MSSKATSLKRLQADRLETMNQFLAFHGLPTLLRTGTCQDGETELVEIDGINRKTYGYWTVTYSAILPDGSRKRFDIQYGIQTAKANPCVIITALNDRLVFVRSHRPALLIHEKSWVNELPRGFLVTGLKPTILDQKLHAKMPEALQDHAGVSTAIGVLGRKLVPLLNRADVHVERFQPLNRIEGEVGLPKEATVYEDTGRSADSQHYWLLNLRTDRPEEVMQTTKGPRQMQLRYLTLREAWAERRQHDIRDNFTYTGLLLYLDATGRINLD